MSVIPRVVRLGPSPEIICGKPSQFDKVPLNIREFLRQLPSSYQNLSVLFKLSSFEDALCVGYPLIQVYSRGDLKVLKYSDSSVAHRANYCGYLMIERIYVSKLPLHNVLLR